MNGIPPSVERAVHVLRDTFNATKLPRRDRVSILSNELLMARGGSSGEEEMPKAADIIVAICDVFSVTVEELRSKSRDSNLVFARRVFALLAVDCLGMSFTQAARVLNRDHTTLVHAIRTSNKRHRLAVAVAVAVAYRIGNVALIDKVLEVQKTGGKVA